MAKILLLQGVFFARTELASEDSQERRPNEGTAGKDRWRVTCHGSLPHERTTPSLPRIATPSPDIAELRAALADGWLFSEGSSRSATPGD